MKRRSLRELLKSLDPRAGHRSLLFQAVLWVAIPFSLTMTVGAVYGLANNVQTRETEFLERGARAGLLAAQALAPAASSADPEGLSAAMEKLAANSELVYASVHDVTGKELARRGPVPAALIAPTAGGVRMDDAGMIHQSVELTHRGVSVGTAWFGLKFNPKFRLVGVTVKDTVTMVVVTSIFAVLMGLLLGRSFGKIFDRILKTIRATAESVDVAAKQLNAATAEQSSASAESASALAETQAVAVEVGTAAATAAARATLLDEVAGRSEVEADEAIRAVAEAQVAVQALREQGHAIDAAIGGFSEKATAVGEIAASVSMLAERSNLLALNAAIEASRAGERGRAFSVVSREMRTLAEATNRSADQVKTIVLDVQGAVAQWTTDSNNGTRKMELAEQTTRAAVEAIRGFGRSTHELAGVGKEIASSGKDQRAAIDQTVEALKQANSAGAEQLDAIRVLEGSSGKLAALSNVLIDTIDGKDTEETRSMAGAAERDDGHGGHRAALRKTMLYIVVPFAVLVLVNTAIAVNNLPSDYDHRLRLVASHHFEGLTPAAQLALESGDRTALRTMLGTLASRDALIYAVAQDDQGRTLAAYGAVPEKLTANPEGALSGEVFQMSRTLPGGAQLYAGYTVAQEKAQRTFGAWVVIRLALVITTLGAVMAWVVNRRYGTVFERLLSKVRGAALRLDELVSQLAAIAAQQAATSSESAAALQETRASAEEVGRGAAASSARAMLLASGGEASEFDAGNATEAVAKAREAIRHLREHVTALTERIALFADRADAIGSVATTVAMLSERSDLLAVNASIEAARSAAGGVQGFGVVAEEMRALADGSSKSAQQVKDIVSDVRTALRRALDDAREGERRARAAELAADSAARRVERFAEVAHEFVRLGNEIGAAATQQRSAIDQMVEAVTQAAEGSATQAMATQSVQQVATALVALSASLVEVTGATAHGGDVTTMSRGQGGGADKGQPTAVAA